MRQPGCQSCCADLAITCEYGAPSADANIYRGCFWLTHPGVLLEDFLGHISTASTSSICLSLASIINLQLPGTTHRLVLLEASRHICYMLLGASDLTGRQIPANGATVHAVERQRTSAKTCFQALGDMACCAINEPNKNSKEEIFNVIKTGYKPRQARPSSALHCICASPSLPAAITSSKTSRQTFLPELHWPSLNLTPNAGRWPP